ncbi:Serine/Threonine kinase (macronuclear) [Tetrahymena thermophila SB210]|uniref:Serine/Threonine kinase n=1 Tax=Tetrahymena thermophila (strain SB210) TaxID=312017 RepID=I7MFT6_TETTS|nr:Serine/Threonine kinase [Tetrahymena thermophila SB210]EAR84288.2 Serine/Threonine kinase [Tetrahymena thermophila SB210]|eukprot:XP_001031951.2 Serine/Threonine kinase [Tetrahymena thermophila SB210]
MLILIFLKFIFEILFALLKYLIKRYTIWFYQLIFLIKKTIYFIIIKNQTLQKLNQKQLKMQKIQILVFLVVIKMYYCQTKEIDFSQKPELADYCLYFERIYIMGNYDFENKTLYYTLYPSLNTKQQYTFYDSYNKQISNTVTQKYPLFYNDQGIQGIASFAIYSIDSERDIITIRIFSGFISSYQINTQETMVQAKKILHSYTFYDTLDNYIFYLQKDDSKIAILCFNTQSKSLDQNIIEINRNCNVFYKNLYFCNDMCVYQVQLKDKQVQSSQYLCLELEDDIIESIQYLQMNYLLIFGKKKVFVFYQKKLMEISPKVQYLLIFIDKNSEILINLDQISQQSQIISENQFNFGVYLENNYYMIGLSDQENYQKTKYLYRLRAAKNRQDIQPYLVPNDSNSQSIYTFYLYNQGYLYNYFYVYNFNYDSGSTILYQVKLNGSYTGFLDQFHNQIFSPFFWDTIAFLIFANFYLLLIRRRKNKSKNIKQQIEAIVFQNQKEISKIEFFQKYDINLNDPLGSGGFGDVYIAKNKHIQMVKNKAILQQMHEKYACKRIIYNKEISFEEQKSSVRNEIEILQKLGKYENVIKVQNYFLDLDQAIIALELAESNLQSIIQKKQENYLYDKFLEKDIVQFLDQIANTIADIYIEEKIAHRDLKPENILFKKGIYYLSDFGISQQIDKASTKENIVFGTIKWMSPELKNLKIKDYQHTQDEIDIFKSDIFSLGLILLYMLTLIDIAQVNQNESLKISRIRGLKMNRQGDIDPLIIQLVSKMLETDPDKRPDPSILKKSIDDIKNMQQDKINKKNNKQA